MGAPTSTQEHTVINLPVLIFSAVTVMIVAGVAIVAPDQVSNAFSTAVNWTGNWFGSFYIAMSTAILAFVVILALSRYGTVRLGPNNATPDFSTFSWAAMLFAAGVGTGIMFYAVAEPVAQYIAPPNAPGETLQAARMSVVYTMFHYGITGWGMYALVGMALGYFAYRHRYPLAVRSTLRPLLGSRLDGWVGDVVDAAALLGGVFGIAASLGVGVVQLNVGLSLMLGLPQATSTQIGLITLSVIMAIVSAVSGVEKGVRILSNINVLLAVGLALWVLVTGNTAFLFDALVTNVGDFIHQFPELTLETYAYNRPTAWLNSWTLFFWAWWITWAAFVGMFLARISRGRTIRQFVLGALVLPFSYVTMWVSIFGNSALDLIFNGDKQFAEVTVSSPEQGLYSLLERFPAGTMLVAVSLFVGILFYVTSADSGALVMANLCIRVGSTHRDAPGWLRVFWAALTGVLTIAMLVAGGIPILQQATIVMALPFSFVLLLIMACLYKALYTEDSRAAARSHIARTSVIGRSGSAGSLGKISWRDRLSQTFDVVSPARAIQALDKRVVPALEAVADELRSESLTATVVREDDSAQDPDDERPFLGRVTLTVGEEDPDAGLKPFRYIVRAVQAPVPTYYGAVVQDSDDVTTRLEVRPTGGGQGYDVMGWSSDQVAHDVLDHYERWHEFMTMAETIEA
ncbi:choline BCCT transporter BetT [Actinomyces vulturis]|uniref:choline BCCT transporter BetT n=1 Tax=Actinomyces vulturis TaxID=1857645 RepID=UPI000835E71D|nr:choline BCCT transporter BetT [Actinomyces vulturis]